MKNAPLGIRGGGHAPDKGERREEMKSRVSWVSRILPFLLISMAVSAMNAERFLPRADDTDVFSGVRAAIRQELRKDGVPSLAVGVAKKGKIIWEEAFGLADIARGIASTPETMYSLASISKPFTATGLMVLVERGLVDLDRPANDYLGEAKLTVFEGDASSVTVKHLLHHTAGLGTHWNFFFANEPAERPDMEESIRRYGICVWPPGTIYNYANFGYGILEHIIERASKMRYPDFMSTEVFEPLGLGRTSVITRAPGDDFVAQRYISARSVLPFYDFDHRGASAVYSSARDLLRFGMFHLKDRLPGQRKILRE
jgi:CubicO group peptidase (beta-lactamase class C family)